MARYGRADKRIHRILDGTVLSRGVTRWSLAAILALGLPLAYVVAAAYPESAPLGQGATAPAAPVQTAGKPPVPDALPAKPTVAGGQDRIESIVIRGNYRTPASTLRKGISINPGDIYNPAKIERAVAALRNMGYDVQDVTSDVPTGTKGGPVVIFYVREKEDAATSPEAVPANQTGPVPSVQVQNEATSARAPGAPGQNLAGFGSIAGIVVNAATGEPIANITVQSWRWGDPPRADTPVADAVTDALGRFKLNGIPPGQYELFASEDDPFHKRFVFHKSFVAHNYSQSGPDGPTAVLTLSPGQKIAGINFQLARAAVISGHIYGEDGKPIAGAMVAAMTYAYIGVQRRLRGNEILRSNVSGEFRLDGLAPGQYFVEVSTPEDTFGWRDAGTAYRPTYYSGVLELNAATPIAVHSGEEVFGINIRLRPVHGVAVRGHLINATCGGNPTVSVVREKFDSLPVASGLAETNGEFELLAVPPGSYYLVAGVGTRDGKRCGDTQPLEVGNTDIDGLTLKLTEGEHYPPGWR